MFVEDEEQENGTCINKANCLCCDKQRPNVLYPESFLQVHSPYFIVGRMMRKLSSLLLAPGLLLSLQSEAQTKPLPRLKDLAGLPVVKRNMQVKGEDVKALVSPAENAKTGSSKLQWQKVLVGQQAVDLATVAGVSKNSPVRRLALQNGDVILRVAGQEVHSQTDLNRALGALDPRNGKVDFKILRQNQVMVIDYELKW